MLMQKSLMQKSLMQKLLMQKFQTHAEIPTLEQVSAPTAVIMYHQPTGEWPNFSNPESTAKVPPRRAPRQPGTKSAPSKYPPAMPARPGEHGRHPAARAARHKLNAANGTAPGAGVGGHLRLPQRGPRPCPRAHRPHPRHRPPRCVRFRRGRFGVSGRHTGGEREEGANLAPIQNGRKKETNLAQREWAAIHCKECLTAAAAAAPQWTSTS